MHSILGNGSVAHCTNLTIFDDKVQHLAQSFQESVGDAFATYFVECVARLLRGNVASGNCTGTSNNAESMNHVLNQATKWKQQKLPDLILTIKSLVDLQIAEEEHAMYGYGEYTLRKSHAQFRRTIDEWQSMSQKQLQAVLSHCFRIQTITKVRLHQAQLTLTIS